VLRRPCPECGLDTSSFARADIPAMIRANAAAWQEPLATPDAVRRPLPGKWSPLEYGCHVRDVFRLYHYRLGLMLTEDDPLYPNWDQDETAVAGRYNEQNPEQVAVEAIAAQLSREGQPAGEGEQAARQRFPFIGMGDSGPGGGDIGRRHDEILREHFADKTARDV